MFRELCLCPMSRDNRYCKVTAIGAIMAQSYEGQPVRVTDRIGDKPAPGQLRIIQAFLNTANPKVGREDFISPEVLKQWLVEHSLLAPGAHVTGVDVRETIAVRDA